MEQLKTINNQKTMVVGGAVLIVYRDREEFHREEIYGGELNTTNNKMELTAVIKALSKIKECYRSSVPVEVYADSNYVVQGITSWIHNWKKKGWRTASKKPVENKDLWIELDNLVQQFEKIDFFKVKGHSDNELNNLADELANKGAFEISYLNQNVQ